MDRLSESDTLWARLRSMDLDRVNVNLPYSRRLARDNAWTLEYATRVVFEYKRFLYLAATVAHPVTPSDEVDQAWHLHFVVFATLLGRSLRRYIKETSTPWPDAWGCRRRSEVFGLVYKDARGIRTSFC
jgi:hypothetical protein